jgi:hypothetical protein
MWAARGTCPLSAECSSLPIGVRRHELRRHKARLTRVTDRFSNSSITNVAHTRRTGHLFNGASPGSFSDRGSDAILLESRAAGRARRGSPRTCERRRAGSTVATRRESTDARVGRVEARGQRRAHVRRQILRVNRDARTGALQLDRCGEADRAAADHADVAFAGRQRAVGGDGPGSPRQRPAAATVPVVVHDRLVADRLNVSARSLRPERPRADRDSCDAIDAGPQQRQLQRGPARRAGCRSQPARVERP